MPGADAPSWSVEERMGKSRLILMLGCAVALATLWTPQRAEACGGFFCGQQPVDQTAERVVFAVDREANTTDMIVQISFQGRASDFAWVVPLGQVPVDGSLDTFPQGALTALDANSSPQVWGGGGCFLDAAAGAPNARDDDGAEVTVHVREEVGPYDVAVVESEDPSALIEWLRDNEFRVTTPMEPYIAEYTSSGMKFLALRLQNDAKVSDIAPFKMTLPGTTPSVPLKMTALAAEPEMGIIVFVIGDQRYEGANWANLTVPDDYLVYDWMTGRSNWAAAVARVVDEAGGQGWVTDTATSLEDYVRRLDVSTPADEDQAAAIEALQGLFEGHTYISRLYTRVSAEEMISDPVFRRSAGADVPRWREIVPEEGIDECLWDGSVPEVSPCDFTACGAGGRCVEAVVDGETRAACACVPGATARTTVGPDGRPTMACQDMRMSFLNPGDRETPGSTPLPDPCVGFDCGAGSCIAMNMTPTCVCDRGMAAVGSIDEDGVRSTTCVAPSRTVPADFYDIRLPARPAELPAGRDVDVPPPSVSLGGGGCAAGGTGAGWLALALPLLVWRRKRA